MQAHQKSGEITKSQKPKVSHARGGMGGLVWNKERKK